MLSARFGCLISVFFALVAVGIFACGLVVCLVLLGIAVVTVAVHAVGIFVGAFVGNYVQQNKDDVKTKLKSWIDRM